MNETKRFPRIDALKLENNRRSLPPKNLLPRIKDLDPPTPKALSRSISEDGFLSLSNSKTFLERPRSRPVRQNFAFGTLENGFSGICRYRNVLWRCNLSDHFHTEFIDQELLDFIRDLKTQRKKYNKLRHRYINDGSRVLRQEVYLHIHEPGVRKVESNTASTPSLVKTPKNSLQIDHTVTSTEESDFFDCTSYTTDAQLLLENNVDFLHLASISDNEVESDREHVIEDSLAPESREQSFVSAQSDLLDAFDDMEDSLSDSVDPEVMVVDLVHDEFSEPHLATTPSGVPMHFTKFTLVDTGDLSVLDSEIVQDNLAETPITDFSFAERAVTATPILVHPPPLESSFAVAKSELSDPISDTDKAESEKERISFITETGRGKADPVNMSTDEEVQKGAMSSVNEIDAVLGNMRDALSEAKDISKDEDQKRMGDAGNLDVLPYVGENEDEEGNLEMKLSDASIGGAECWSPKSSLTALLQQKKLMLNPDCPNVNLKESDEEVIEAKPEVPKLSAVRINGGGDLGIERLFHSEPAPKSSAQKRLPVSERRNTTNENSQQKLSRATTLEDVPAFCDPLTAHMRNDSSLKIPQTLKELGSNEVDPLLYFETDAELQSPVSPSESRVVIHPDSAKEDKASDKNLWLLIIKDVERTLQKRAQFQDLKIKYLLANILFIWAKENQTIGYQQGMNELVAMIIVALSHDCDQVQMISDDEDPFELKNLLRPVYLEHDVYTLFDLMIHKISGFYEPDNTLPLEPWRGGLLQDLHNDTITKKLFHIHHRLLRYLDLTLYNHLRSLQIHPQHYLFRWVRLLLCREFDTLISLTVWDHIFYESEGDKSLYLLDFFCVAIIILKRDEIMALTDMSVVQLLQNQDNELRDITVDKLFEKATELKKKWMDGPQHGYSEKELQTFRIEANGEFKATQPGSSFPSQDRSVTIDHGASSMALKKVYIHGMKPLGPEQSHHIKWCLFSHYGRNFVYKNGNILREGYLVKRGGGNSMFGRRSFKRRWTVIQGEKLAYFKNEHSTTPQREWILLPGRTVTVVSAEHFAFALSGTTSEARSILFFAQNEKEFLLWLHALTLKCEHVEFYT